MADGALTSKKACAQTPDETAASSSAAIPMTRAGLLMVRDPSPFSAAGTNGCITGLFRIARESTCRFLCGWTRWATGPLPADRPRAQTMVQFGEHGRPRSEERRVGT